MDKEKLEQKIAELLEVNESESSFAFNKFKEKLVELLNLGEAIKISNLGVFQLKEQLSDNLADIKKSKPTLLFSPDPSLASENSLFLTLEVDTKRSDPNVFDENVFQVGIGKQMIPLDDSESQEGNTNSINIMDQKVDALLNNAERIKNFDLWDDYLERKKSESIIDEDKIKDELDSLIDDDMISKVTDQLFEDDFEELDEDEIFNELINKGNLDSGQLDEITSKDSGTVETDDILDQVLGDNTSEVDSDFNVESEEVSDNLEMNDIPEIDELDNADVPDVEDINMDLALDDTIENENFIDNLESEIEVEGKSKLRITPIIEKKLTEVKPRLTTEKYSETPSDKLQSKLVNKKKSPIVYLLMAIFIIIAAIGIYYLYLANPTWLYDPHETEIKLSEQHAKEFEDARLSKAVDNLGEGEESTLASLKDSIAEVPLESEVKGLTTPLTQKENITPTPTTKEKVLDSKKEVKKSEPIKTAVENKTVTTLSEANKNETETSKNIYYDGNGYTVQVSSWKQLKLAEDDVNRLTKLGYSTQIIKAFVPKFNGTWHRVRIGPYKTLDEAKLKQTQFK